MTTTQLFCPNSLVTKLSSQTEQPAPVRIRPGWSPSIPDVQPLVIGDVKIELPIIQAALSGYSDWPMRALARQLGAPYTIAEVMIDQFVNDLKSNRDRTKHFLHVADDDHPVGGQLMGSNIDEFAPAAQRLVDARFDVIDINFGCPVKTAMGGCRGGYHLGQPEAALEIVSRVRESVPENIPVTLKMRRGIDDSSSSHNQFFRILDGAFELGVAAITVHGRTVEQKYNGPSSWDFLSEVKRHAGTKTVIGSGDVFSAQDCLDMLSYTGVDGVSVARGAIGNPWIFSQALQLLNGETPQPPSVFDQRDALLQQMEFCQQVYTDKQSAGTMRKFGIKFSRWHTEYENVRDAFAATRTVDMWRSVIDEWYC
jgi:tRNA-dihydrouridine synthase B